MGIVTHVKKLLGKAPNEAVAPHDERRRHRRIQDSKLTIIIDGTRYKTKDWSLGGFRLHVPEMTVYTNDDIAGEIHGPGLFDRGDFKACVAWTSENGEFGVRFVEISGETARAMAAAQS